MKLAIGIIHGIGSQEPGFSIPLQKGIAKTFSELGVEHAWNDLLFKEILWADILSYQQKLLFERINYQNDLRYQNARHFFIDYFSDAVAYQPLQVGANEDEIAVYELIHQRIDSALQEFALHPQIDADNTPLILIGHSLGTVILSNYLWDQQRSSKGTTALTRTDTLAGLVTLGSPLALWTLRYKSFGIPIQFPGKQVSEALRQQSRWLNIYDHDDIIACPLKGLNPAYNEVVTDDIPLNVGGLLSSWNPMSHVDYWVDQDVYRVIAGFLADLHRR